MNSLPPTLGTSRTVSAGIAVALGAGAITSLGIGVRHALKYGSSDLQWAGSVLIWKHIDPWAERLAQSPHHFLHFSPPNYLHLLYLLFLPFALLPFATVQAMWCGCSVLCSVVVVRLLSDYFDLTRQQSFVVLTLLWMSSPFRVVLEVGQLSIFELLFFCLVFTTRTSVASGISLGISLVKYSFSPVVAVFLFFRQRYLVLFVAAAVCCAGLVGCFLLLPTPLLQLSREPFLVSRVAVNPGVADLMTLSELSLRSWMRDGTAQALSYGVALFGGAACGAWISRLRLSKGADLSLLSLASLLFFKHLIYDYVFLLIPLCYGFSLRVPRFIKAPIIGGVFVFWYCAGLINNANHGTQVSMRALTANCSLLAMFFVFTLGVARGEAHKHHLAF